MEDCCERSATFHNKIVPSSNPSTRVLPSGLKDNMIAALRFDDSNIPNCWRVAVSQRTTLPSSNPAASSVELEVGSNAREMTTGKASAIFKGRLSPRFHTVIPFSSGMARSFPSLLKARKVDSEEDGFKGL